VALLAACGSMIVKAAMQRRRVSRGLSDGSNNRLSDLHVRKVPTILIGALGGLVVGMTSVGSGSLIIVFLLFLYPRLTAPSLVGTDLVQAVPLVASAALAHILFGDFSLGLTLSILVGSVPGVFFGAQMSSRSPDALVRKALIFVLAASGLKLVNVGTTQLGWIMGVAFVAMFVVPFVLKRMHVQVRTPVWLRNLGIGSVPPQPVAPQGALVPARVGAADGVARGAALEPER
jgi:hypothetical protein